MNKLAFIIVFLVFSTLGTCFSQEIKPTNSLEKGKFFADFGIEMRGRNFESGTFLGDAYQLSLGYRFSVDFGISGYPGLGFYGGGQGANVLENQFLGGFFEESRVRDSGIFVFHLIPVGNRFVIRPELGFGSFRMVHGISPSRFILNYSHFFGKLGVQYPIVDISENFRLNLTLGTSYGRYNGNEIVINDQDRNYIQRSSDFQIYSGILILIH